MAKPKKGLGRGLGALMGSAEYPTVSEQEETTTSQTSPSPSPAREVIRESDLSTEDRETISVESGENDPYGKSWQRAQAVTPIPRPVDTRVAGDVPRNAYVEPVVYQRDVVASADDEITGADPVVEIFRPDDQSPVVVPSPSEEAEVPQSTSQDETENLLQVKQTDEVSIELVYPNPNQPRTHFDQDELEELTTSIKKDGLLQPILVRERGTGYEIIAGERRWQASKKAGLTKVPIRIKEADDYQVLELALIENLQRSDLNPIEEAYGYKRMMERGGKTQSEIALAVSKGRSTIANALRLLDLPEDAQKLLFEGVITAGHARAILSIPSEEGKKKLTEKLTNEKLSVREAESIARLLASKDNPKPKVKKDPVPQLYKTAAKTLTKEYGSKVRIRNTGGKNRIEIEFKDEEDLQRLFDLMNPAR
ncbi:MAG: ParB/RepB/Spo0J family partition protein [Eggerthellales bacterium]|nr:ParB/RepB/Spo0J family partition protein [Eggerthellales bacterium]